MEAILTLDVTKIEPRFKHPRIFEEFDALKPDKAFIIHNDHDPKPLYYQLLGERGNVFTWEYLENGPATWEVKIGKLDTSQPQETIGEIVAKDYRKAQVFKNRGIDFCCGGKKTLEQVCESKGIDLESVKTELAEIANIEPGSGLAFDKWELDFLSDYIVNTHHNYVRESIPFLSELANKVARVHGDRHGELVEVARIFNRVASDLSLHLMKEENILFPFIKQLTQAAKNGTAIVRAPFGTVNNPTQMMEVEHEHAGEDLAAIRELTNDYSLPPDACTSYTILFKKLQEFENDLFNHVHLENNILFPKAIQLEKDLGI
ncbi:iron-sulfur cluster repair di-iron protein [Desertivirga xinjiangensis]|uniref:iron-sulfur cluster repair di-iron protein n=1 Tax=Desertivirga xinjiangensis TaxID=539206 RepID=UPI00210BBE7A|nr:iron-sulfur cluster repair di-iron protein [Pedobacter xinjiangensis]